MDVFQAMVELLSERLECDPASITRESNFRELGIDSLDTVELLMDLEDKIGIEIELNQKVDTVGDLVTFIENKQKEQ